MTGRLEEWLRAVQALPDIVEVRVEGNHIVAVASTRERGKEARAAAEHLGIPRDALRIRVSRYWLDPYPGDPEKGEQLFQAQTEEWEKEDEGL